jgi:hypothetical protein
MALEKLLMQADLEEDLKFLETVILKVYLTHEKRKAELIIVKLFSKDSLNLLIMINLLCKDLIFKVVVVLQDLKCLVELLMISLQDYHNISIVLALKRGIGKKVKLMILVVKELQLGINLQD